MRDGRPSTGSQPRAAQSGTLAKMTLAAIAEALIQKDSLPGRPYVAFSANSGAWILVPDAAPVRAAGLALYHPQSIRGAVAKSLIASGAWRPQSRRVNEQTLDELADTLKDHVGVRDLHCAFYLRAPGPFAKAIVLAMDKTGRAIAYAKLAATRQAAQAIAHEADVLGRLAQIPALKDSIPRVIGEASWRDYPMLILAAGPTRNPPRQFGPEHLAFLARLRDATRSTIPLSGSRMLTDMRMRFAASADALPAEWRDRHEWALGEIDRRANGASMALGLAHGDFVPWNMRCSASGSLFVYDWELAAEQRTEGWDAFHFHLARYAFGVETRSSVALPGLLALVSPGARDTAELLLLSYLSDVTLFCQHRLVEARAATNNSFISAAGAMLDALRRRL